MFSSRTNWNLAPNQLHQLLEEKRNAGVRILDLTESNPTRCSFSYDPAILEALSAHQSMFYEPNPRGLRSAREVVAGRYHSQNVRIDPDNIFLTAGTSEAYGHLFKLLCNPGENVLVPKPSYPLFDYLCELNDVEARHYQLRYYDEWQVDLESLHLAVDKSTRAILLVHPNNPTGSFIKPKERESITKFARENNLALIVDEVFLEFPLQVGHRMPESFAGEQQGLVFTLNGISKTLGLPQMKLAWITASGDRELVGDAVKRLEIITDTYLTVGTPVQHALDSLFQGSTKTTEQIRQRVQRNLRTLGTVLVKTPLSLLQTEAGWNAIIHLPGTKSDEAWALQFLMNSDVLVYPGHFFEIDDRSCVVVSLLAEEPSFNDGIQRLIRAVVSGIPGSS